MPPTEVCAAASEISSSSNEVTVRACSSAADCDKVAALCGSSFPEEVHSQGLSVQQWSQIESEVLKATPSWWRQIGARALPGATLPRRLAPARAPAPALQLVTAPTCLRRVTGGRQRAAAHCSELQLYVCCRPNLPAPNFHRLPGASRRPTDIFAHSQPTPLTLVSQAWLARVTSCWEL